MRCFILYTHIPSYFELFSLACIAYLVFYKECAILKTAQGGSDAQCAKNKSILRQDVLSAIR
jgi:hypothetical protein